MTITRTGFIEGDVDLNETLIQKSYIIDVYPAISCNFKYSNIYGWGQNTYGSIGNGNTSNMSTPVLESLGASNWKCIAEGHGQQAAAIRTITANEGCRDLAYMWGYNGDGQLGDGTTDSFGKTFPIYSTVRGGNWRILVTGGRQTGGIKQDGSLWLWGFNTCGTLGDGTTVSKSSPVQTISGGFCWKTVSIGDNDSAGAIKEDGTLWMWGRNDDCQLGRYTTVCFTCSPAQTEPGGNNWRSLSIGDSFAGAIKSDGTLWMWGLGNLGRLGSGNNDRVSCPIQTIAGGTNWNKLSIGSCHSAAIKTDGSLWLWGSGTFGQLGTNTTTNMSSPVQTITGGTNWKYVSAGSNHTAAIKADGTMWLWGNNQYGQLGNGTTVNSSSPVQTSIGGNNWKQVAAGYLRTLALFEGGDW